MRAAVYTRVSRDRNGTDSTERQEAACRAFCAMRGWDVAEPVFSDRGISAWSGVDRPGWLALEKAVKEKKVDAVVVFAISRAARNTRRLLEFAELCDDQGVQLESTSEPIGGNYGRVFLTILGALAQLESQTKSARVLDKFAAKKIRGEWHGGYRLYGFRPEGKPARLVVDKAEARAIVQAATDVLNNVAEGTICRRWNDAGSRTTTGRRWTQTTLRKLLSNPQLVPDILIASDQAKLVQKFNGRKTGRVTSGEYLLSGLTWCEEHDKPMGGGGGKYRCRHGEDGRAHLQINAKFVDEIVTEACAARPDPEVVAVHDPSEPLVRQREAVEQQMVDLGESDLPEPVIRGKARKLQRQLEALDAEIARTRPSKYGFAKLAETVESWDDRAWIESLVERVVIKPPRKRRGFDRRRVRIVWR